MAILSRSAERILFPVQSGVGHTILLRSNGPWHTVVGVVEDVRNLGLTEAPQPEVYVVRPATPGILDRYGNFAIRTTAAPADAAAFLRQAVADLDPELPVEIRTLDDDVTALSERPRFVAWLLVAFAGLGILLAAAGLYGVASYLVAQRTRDIGVRMALGATPADVARQVVGEAGMWVVVGGVSGGALAWAGTRAIESQLYGVGTTDPLSWAIALVSLGAALLAAIVPPAVRAACIDPNAALRTD